MIDLLALVGLGSGNTTLTLATTLFQVTITRFTRSEEEERDSILLKLYEDLFLEDKSLLDPIVR